MASPVSGDGDANQPAGVQGTGSPGVQGIGIVGTGIGVLGAPQDTSPLPLFFIGVKGDGGSGVDFPIGQPRFGVVGTVAAPLGSGVQGSNAQNIGVEGVGIVGVSGTGQTGVRGFSDAGSGVEGGLGGTDPVLFQPVGAYGTSNNQGVVGLSKGDGAGVFGSNNSNGPKGRGVQGNGPEAGVAGFSEGGTGVLGQSTTASGVVATSRDGQGVSTFSTNDIAIFAKGGKFAGVFDGNVDVSQTLTVGGDVVLRNADCAEDFDIADAEVVEPGTVMVVGEAGTLYRSHQAYDKRVAGVISGGGDFKPGIVLDKQHSQLSRKPIALLGKVYCKVDASYAPIEVGDLLTTAPTLGHAMKASDPLKAFGSVIGKALCHLANGRGLIPILIALQ